MKLRLLLFSLLVLSFLASFGQDRVYWSDQEDPDKISSVIASDLSSLATPVYPSVPGGIAYFHANPTYPLFYIESFSISRNDLAGHANLVLTTSNQFNRGLAIDYIGKKVYWTNSQTGKIGRANLDGTDKNEDFITGLTVPWAIEIDPLNQKVYWSEDVAEGAIRRANLSDGSSIESVISNVQSLGIAVDPLRNKIFFTTFQDSKVHSANMDGTDQTVIAGLSAIADVEVSLATGSIYTIDYQSGPLTKSNPDGKGKTSVTAKGAFITYADVTTPTISSIVRQTPTATTLGQNAKATFRVTFSEPVLKFDVTDLELDSPIDGTVTVTPVNLNMVYDVTIEDISGTGTLGLGLSATQDIVDFRGNVFTGTITTEQSYTVTSSPMPFITAFDPATAPINGVVTISGTGFSATTGDNTVTFNGIIAPVTGSTTTTITTAVPPGATDGPIGVSVNGLQAISENDFIVCIPPAKPTITRQGNVLTSSAEEGNQWFYNYNEIAGATERSHTALQPGEYTVKVTQGGCTSTTSDPTAVTDEILTPVVSGFTPDAGTSGTEVVITGLTFGSTGENVVKFNGVMAEVTASSPTSITAKVPSGAGTGPISVTYNTRTGISGGNFTYVCVPPAKPVITHDGGLLTSSSSTNNQWLRNGVEIAGATSQSYTASEGGSYSVKVTADGCSTTSDPTTLVGVEERFSSSVSVYPNPATSSLMVQFPQEVHEATIAIYSMTGTEKETIVLSETSSTVINLSHYGKGTYLVVVTTRGVKVRRKFQKI